MSIINEKKRQFVNEVKDLRSKLRNGYYVDHNKAIDFMTEAVQPFKAIDAAIAAALLDLMITAYNALLKDNSYTAKEYERIIDDFCDLLLDGPNVTISQMSIAMSEEFIEHDTEVKTVMDDCFCSFIGFFFILNSRFDWMEVKELSK